MVVPTTIEIRSRPMTLVGIGRADVSVGNIDVSSQSVFIEAMDALPTDLGSDVHGKESPRKNVHFTSPYR